MFRRGHSRSNSARSDASKAFKDILDAQSEIKPADFRARVKAAGVRDYGEDVAERNLAQNGLDLESPHVQAYYAPSRDQFGSKARPKLDPYKAGVRRRPTRSTSQYTFPRHAAHEMPSTILKLRSEAASSRPPSRHSISRASSHANTTTFFLPDDDDALEYPPPIRTRSMRGWSASSGTPTAAESIAASISTATSSHFFRRPLYPYRRYLDDYLSSDADSFITPSQKPQRPTAAGEEGLLFNDLMGYGVGGMQLPGLADALPTLPFASSPPRYRGKTKAVRRSSSASCGIGHVRHWDGDDLQIVPRGALGTEQGRKRRARARSYMAMTALMMMAEEEAEEEEEREERRTRTRRFVLDAAAAAAAAADVDDDEKEEGCRKLEVRPQGKVDAAAAVRLRKAAKRAKRLAGDPSLARIRAERQRVGARMSVPILRVIEA
ncbi:hypothetical protein N0V88_003058 [Collariella sp. IMI 366227]|nr:hypothetical protein N0V88_003058 [Collariella sp. IMI 366227]